MTPQYQSELKQKTFDYLDRLKSLPDDWICGYSESPSEIAIETAKKYIGKFPVAEMDKCKNTLFSPSLYGGIDIEFHFDDGRSLYVSINKTGNIKIEEIENK